MSRCVIVYGRREVTQHDRLLVGELSGRGYEVHCVLAPSTNDRMPAPLRWAMAIRGRLESSAFRGPEGVALGDVCTQSVQEADAAERAAAIVAALQPAFVIHFGDRRTAGAIAAAVAVDVYQVWLDGWPETLWMTSAFVAADAARVLAVTRLRSGWAQARVVDRAEIIPIHLWAAADQVSAAARAVTLLLRVVHVSNDDGEIDRPPSASAAKTLAATARVFAAAVSRRATRRWMREDAWFLAYRRRDEPFRYAFGGERCFFADPCAVSHGGETLVFHEDFDYHRGRGVIAVSRLDEGELGPPTTVLERPYHLSYPFVFEEDGQWWMTPETWERRTVELYRAVDFPTSWTLEKTLLTNLDAADATLYHDDRWWMFVSVGEYRSSTWDELWIFIADELRGPWRQHPGNPVKKSARSARPAGRLFRRGGELVRPAQDCSRIYGGGIRLCVVDVLTETDYSEHETEFIAPSIVPGAEALHTISFADDLQVFDARLPSAWLKPSRVRKQLAAARRRAGDTA